MDEQDPDDVTTRENLYVLTAVHAALGLISHQVHAVGIHIERDIVTLHVWFDGAPEPVIDDAIDVADDLEAMLMPDNPSIRYELHEGLPSVERRDRSGIRMFYWAKATAP